LKQGRFEMDDGFKKMMIYATLGSFVVTMPIVPFDDCGPRQICAVVPDHAGHTHDREPAPVQTVQQITVTASTASSGGTYYSVIK
jgi:hypothetical protein